MSTLIHITTFQKTDALRELVVSLYVHGYHVGNTILISDDNGGNPYTVSRTGNPSHPVWKNTDESIQEVEMQSVPEFVEEFKETLNIDLRCNFGKGRGGVSINKNRGIKYFLEHPEYDDILMLDDDITFVGPDLIEHCRASGHKHLCGYLGSPDDKPGWPLHSGQTGNSFFTVFPARGEDEYVYYCTGAQGMMMYVTRDLLQKVKYFPLYKHPYGLEHAAWSNRLNMADGKYLDWFPVLKESPRYFITQQIPNNYEVKDPFANHKEWDKQKQEIFRGIGICNNIPGKLD